MDYPKDRMIAVIRRSARLLVASQGKFRHKNWLPKRAMLEEVMVLPGNISWPLKLCSAKSQSAADPNREDLAVAAHIESLDDATVRELIKEALTKINDD
jgi:hypothetical protein